MNWVVKQVRIRCCFCYALSSLPRLLPARHTSLSFVLIHPPICFHFTALFARPRILTLRGTVGVLPRSTLPTAHNVLEAEDTAT